MTTVLRVGSLYAKLGSYDTRRQLLAGYQLTGTTTQSVYLKLIIRICDSKLAYMAEVSHIDNFLVQRVSEAKVGCDSILIIVTSFTYQV